MSDCAMPSTPAHALPLSGCAVRKSTSWSTSQLDTFSVPPYRPSVAPDTTFAPFVLDVLVALGEADEVDELELEAPGVVLVGEAV